MKKFNNGVSDWWISPFQEFWGTFGHFSFQPASFDQAWEQNTLHRSNPEDVRISLEVINEALSGIL